MGDGERGGLREQIAADGDFVGGVLGQRNANGIADAVAEQGTNPDGALDAAVFAFAGIGRPQKFFDTLITAGALVKGTQEFADHHLYDAQDLQGLRDQAKGIPLVTTEKDLVRIAPEQRHDIAALAVDARFDDPAALEALLAGAAP